jgi:hypothetical protein
MAKAAKKSITNIIASHPTCPVVDLSQQLADLFDAEEGCGYADIESQIAAWRTAVAELISFTQAKSAAGALVQMALALSELDTLSELGEGESADEYNARIERLIRSAMHAVRVSLGAEYEAVRATVESYSGADVADHWSNRIQTFAQAFREDQTKPERQQKAA